jgi:hypothetical protein
MERLVEPLNERTNETNSKPWLLPCSRSCVAAESRSRGVRTFFWWRGAFHPLGQVPLLQLDEPHSPWSRGAEEEVVKVLEDGRWKYYHEHIKRYLSSEYRLV